MFAKIGGVLDRRSTTLREGGEAGPGGSELGDAAIRRSAARVAAG
jgi:hypothetical protein